MGPQLPPHLQGKRKHDDSGGDSDSSDEGSMGPAPPSEKRRKVEDEPSEAKLAPEPAPKSGPRIGPTPPPGPLDQRPLSRQDDDSESDDDYGPAPPPVQVAENAPVKSIFDQESTGETRKPEEKRRRDDWMMLPPQQDDLAARLDPTKLKARGFNTGKSAKQGGGKGGISSIWTETPEERRQRLQDQVMGVKVDESGSKATAKDHRKEQENEEKARKIREHNVSPLQIPGHVLEEGISNRHRRRGSDRRACWSNTRRPARRRWRMTRASGHLTTRRTLPLGPRWDTRRGGRCSTKLATSAPSSPRAVICRVEIPRIQVAQRVFSRQSSRKIHKAESAW